MSLFKEKIKYLRKDHDLTREELAKLLRVSGSSVSMYERGERMPTVQGLKDIIEIFKVDFNYLLDDTRDVKDVLPRIRCEEDQVVCMVDRNALNAARFLFENPEYVDVFKSIKTIKKEDLGFLKAMIEKIQT